MLKNLPVKTQLTVGFASVIGLFVITLIIVGTLLSQLTQRVHEIDEKILPLVLVIDEMNLSRSEVQQFLTDVSATHDTAAYQEAEEAAQRFKNGVNEYKKHLTKTNDTTRLKQLEQIDRHFDTLYALGKTMAKAYVEQGRDAGNAKMKGDGQTKGFDQASADLSEQLDAFRKGEITDAGTATEDALLAARSITSTMVLGGLIASVIGTLYALFIVRGLMQQLGGEPRLATALAQRVGEGDLTTPIELRADDTSSLMAQLQLMQTKLAEVVHTVRNGAEGVANASAEIAMGNHDLSNRTEQQACSLEETAASMDELSSTVQQNADSARQANQLAAQASTIASEGGSVVGQVVETMREINESSRKISDISSMIDTIAFQTNILALNAAVEAARAGEQGRGFAVVASEVRSLASRSAEAAKQIKTLINASVERVEKGTVLVDQAGGTMNEVVTAIKRVTDIMGEISSASHEQSLGVSQVSEAVNHMDQATQQNAALVEEMAAAASSLKTQATDLVNVVAAFKLGNDSTPRTAGLSAPSMPAPRVAAPVYRPAPAKPASPAKTAPPPAPKAATPASAPKVALPSPPPPPPAAAKASSDNDGWETF